MCQYMQRDTMYMYCMHIAQVLKILYGGFLRIILFYCVLYHVYSGLHSALQHFHKNSYL